ncbi:hypothetical protein AMEX_G5597 [Astyanax mexicanus]|uniref:Ig-like domain-containing protein n=1 Tax=Astyanax mexicanus TaxID=7994 RepID=A0A8T2MEQ9_ASTMX|nr:hypothetical protein AMEX_G5597 [Astyanax mexicanus]
MDEFFLVLLLAAGLKALQIEGPSGPLVVQLGGDVVLPCYTQDPVPLEGLRVEWRSDSDSEESVVNVFQQNEVRSDLQSPAFRGRVNFFPDQISRGNFSIFLSNIRTEDAGVYRCKVYTDQDSSETTVEIKDIERFVVMGAHHPVVASVGEEVILNCSVDSHIPVHLLEEVTWTKHPDILVLLFKKNETLPEASNDRYQGRAEFFSSEIPRGNFSLRLKDVRLEDTGEFICAAHAADLSAQTTVLIQQMGFSSLQKCILVLCFIASSLAFGLGIPVSILLWKEATTRRVLVMYLLQAFCPNLCMFIGFVLWSKEGLLNEVVVCAAVIFARPLILMKTAPYLNTLPERLVKEVKRLGFPLHCIIIMMAVFSVEFAHYEEGTFGLFESSTMLITNAVLSVGAVVSAKYACRTFSFLCLVICNINLLIMSLYSETTESPAMVTATSSFVVGMVLLFSLQRHVFQLKPFTRLHIGLLSAVVAVACIFLTVCSVFVGIYLGNFVNTWKFQFTAGIYIILWVALVLVVRRQHKNNKDRFCAKWRGLGYMCCAVLISISILANGLLYVYYIKDNMKSKDSSGYLAVMALLHIVPPGSLFVHPIKIPKIPHFILYMFGASGLSIVTSLTLATELILKGGTGGQTLPEMHVIILPFESLYIVVWLCLQIHDFWMRKKDRIKRNFEDGEEAEPQAAAEGTELETPLTKTPKP